MFTLIALSIFILKFLAVGVVGLFFMEDLELTKSADSIIYSVYFIAGVITFFSLLFFALGKKIMWLIVCGISGFIYIQMYNFAPSIKEIHQHNDLKSRYFSDTTTFVTRMGDVINSLAKKTNTN